MACSRSDLFRRPPLDIDIVSALCIDLGTFSRQMPRQIESGRLLHGHYLRDVSLVTSAHWEEQCFKSEEIGEQHGQCVCRIIKAYWPISKPR
jgi:hypothetical protein